MEKKDVEDERWALENTVETGGEETEEEEDEDEVDDETLSLSDLPLIIHKKEENIISTSNRASHDPNNKEKQQIQQPDFDFDFCSQLSKESSAAEMCAADEIFFQGQILPLHHSSLSYSTSSEKGLLLRLQYCKTRSHYYSGSGGGLLISSRSSSISSSHQSSSSGSSSSIGGPKSLPARNHFHFHSHPSPSPRIHFSSKTKHMINANNIHRNKKSSVWNIFRLGLLTTPPEIAFQQDLKPRFQNSNTSTNCNNFGSRNSTDSNSSRNYNYSNKKKKNRTLLLGGCRCSVVDDAVDTVRRSRVVIIKRSASDSALHHELEQENAEATMIKPAKKHLSHHRTFEWLKQLSLEDAAADEA